MIINKYKYLFILVIIPILVTIVYIYWGSWNRSANLNEPVSGNDGCYLSKEDLRILSLKGEKGDVDAANKVWEYYEYYKYNKAKSLYWIKIRAELGDINGQNLLAGILLDSNDKKEAYFWYKKSAEKGDDFAKYMLRIWLTEKEIVKLKKRRGDPNAAFKLYEYYRSIENNYKEADVWLIIAAENGHDEAREIVNRWKGKAALRAK